MKKITLRGLVATEPELKPSKSGITYLEFRLAVGVGTKDSPATEWWGIRIKGDSQIAVDIQNKNVLTLTGYPVFGAYKDKEGNAKVSLTLYPETVEKYNKQAVEAF